MTRAKFYKNCYESVFIPTIKTVIHRKYNDSIAEKDNKKDYKKDNFLSKYPF